MNFRRRKLNTSLRAVVTALRGSRNSVHRILQCEGLHSYRLQRIQSVLPSDHPAVVNFAQWYPDKCHQEPHFTSYILSRISHEIIYSMNIVHRPQCGFRIWRESPWHEITCCPTSLFRVCLGWYDR